jgi:CRISPR-associated protein Cmr6
MINVKPPVAKEVSDVVGTFAEEVDNRSLLLDKFILHKSWPVVTLESNGLPLKLDDASRWSFIRVAQNGDSFLRAESEKLESASRSRNAIPKNIEKAGLLKEIVAHLVRSRCRTLPGNLEKLKLEQNRQFASALSSFKGRTAVVYGKLKGRLLLNLSDSLIQNAGICLDRHTGLPYIPGSAVKGVARHAALARLDAGDWSIREFMSVFGVSEADFKPQGDLSRFAEDVPKEEWLQKGGIDFLAANPITEPRIVVDISTVHHGEYYQSGKTAKLSVEKPKPNSFPAVEAGAEYAFSVVLNGMGTVDSALFSKVRSVLVEAIAVHGIGAKTGAGYGWFEDMTTEVERRVQDEIERKRQKQQAADAKKKAEEEASRRKEVAVRMAALPPSQRILEQWSRSGGVKAIVNGNDIKKFDALGDSDKQGVVEALRSESGLGHDVWLAVTGRSPDGKLAKLRNQQAESLIRHHCKVLKLQGGMP